MDTAKVSTAELSRRIGGFEQTLAHLAKGDADKKTRASRRAAIARALGVAEELLAGELVFLPTGARLGFEYMYSPRAWLAAQRLFTECDKAARRDLAERGTAAADEADHVLHVLDGVLRTLMAIGTWRARLIRWKTPRSEAQGYVEPLAENPLIPYDSLPVVDDAHDSGVLALMHALEHVLTPWFTGDAVLDYAALNELTMIAPHTPAREEPRALLFGRHVTSTVIELT